MRTDAELLKLFNEFAAHTLEFAVRSIYELGANDVMRPAESHGTQPPPESYPPLSNG